MKRTLIATAYGVRNGLCAVTREYACYSDASLSYMCNSSLVYIETHRDRLIQKKILPAVQCTAN